MAAYARSRRLPAVLIVSLFVLGLAVEAHAYHGVGKYGNTDTDSLKKKRRERIAKEAEKYVEAFKAVQKEEEQADRLLDEEVQKARSEADGDKVKEKRGVRLARHKGIKALLRADGKYGRLFAGVRKFKADESEYFDDETKGRIEILLVQVKDRARTNRERIADLYIDVDEPIKALKVLEGIYKSLSPNERMTASDLKGRIKSLKDQLGIKDDAGRR